MGVFIYVRNVILFCSSMEDMKEVRKQLKLNLNLKETKKCEYCDWVPNCCEWCRKIKLSNKRKIETIEAEKKKRNNSI